ncbi:MAG: rod shape-determining protein MreC [Bacteroidales bacterium]|nr:rod shape-determining protein MreC [Bacteroidales bacterium]
MRKSNLISYLINAAIFIILEIAALNMLRNNGPLQNTWFSRGAQNFMGAVWGGTESIAEYFSLRKTNKLLSQENEALKMRVTQLEAAAAMRGQESMVPASDDYVFIPAEIVKISNNTQHNYIIIGKGSYDGVTEGSGVITGHGAIGVIDAVSPRFSYARSFKNHDMSISARIGREGSVGPLTWDGTSSSGAVLSEIPHHVEFEVGDTVYTSGYSSIFPPDIPLGTIGKSKIVNGATYEIDIRLFEDYGALRYVMVVGHEGKEEMKELEEGT